MVFVFIMKSDENTSKPCMFLSLNVVESTSTDGWLENRLWVNTDSSALQYRANNITQQLCFIIHHIFF